MKNIHLLLPVYAMIIFFTITNIFKLNHNSSVYSSYLIIIAIYCILKFLFSLNFFYKTSDTYYTLILPIIFLFILLLSNLYYFGLDFSTPLLQVYIVQCIPAYYMGLLLKTQNKIGIFYKYTDFISSFTSISIFIFLLMGDRNQFGLYSSFGEAGYQFIGYTNALFFIYNTSYFILVFNDKLYSTKVLLVLRFMVLSIQLYLIFSSGTRGAILVIVLVVFFVLMKQLTVKSILLVLLILAILIFIIVNFESGAINSGVDRFTLIFEGENQLIDWNKTGRVKVYSDAISLFKRKPLLGVGAFGYQALTNNVYPHNLILEILTSYGILGTIVFISLLIPIINRAIKYKKFELFMYMILLYSLINLQFSSSFIGNYYFWFAIGYWVPTKLYRKF